MKNHLILAPSVDETTRRGRQEKTPIAVFSFLNFCRMKLVLLLLATAAGGGAHAFVTDFEAMKSFAAELNFPYNFKEAVDNLCDPCGQWTDASGQNSTWCSKAGVSPHCSIECTNTSGRVENITFTRLADGGSALSGSLSSSLANLTQLLKLDIRAQKQITGAIPALPMSLRIVLLSGNGLSLQTSSSPGPASSGAELPPALSSSLLIDCDI